MNFYDLINARYSVRAYKTDPVEDEKLGRILDAARLAPTAANRQPFRLLVAKTEGRQKEFMRIYNKEWFVQAPIIVCACAVPSEGWVRADGRNYCNEDVMIVMDHLILAAAEEGLGTCWIAAFDPDAARKVLKISSNLEPVVLTPLGYSNIKPGHKNRRPLEELAMYI